MRRMRARGSAGGLGASPCCCMRASTKRSSGCWLQAVGFGVGGCGWVRGWKAQCFRTAAGSTPDLATATLSRGSGAPSFTHCSSAATSSEPSARLGGICKSLSFRRTAWMRRLLSGSPGTMTAPCSPPFCQPGLVSRRRPPSCFFSPWHFWQCSMKSGRIFASKKAGPSGLAALIATEPLSSTARIVEPRMKHGRNTDGTEEARPPCCTRLCVFNPCFIRG